MEILILVERESDSVMLPELVVDRRVGDGVLPDHALSVHEREMIALGERLERAFQLTLGLELAVVVIAVRRVIPLVEFRGRSGRDGRRDR